jgi:DNA replication ATP-dependent helicase Dna2
MPPKQPPRPGFEHLMREGDEWQTAKILDLTETFGREMIIGNRVAVAPNRISYHPIDLIDVLPRVFVGVFLIEAEFEVGDTFELDLGVQSYRTDYDLSYARLRPDIIEVLPPCESPKFVAPDGRTEWLPQYDQRRQLRIIDVKLTAEPSPEHFAEVTYYSMALAGWLVDHKLSDQYVVVPCAAIWPGSHDASQLVRVSREAKDQGRIPATKELRRAMGDDLESVPFEVFASRVRQFLCEDVPHVLSLHWEELPWHVDHRCKGCDWIGYLNWVNSKGEPTYQSKHCIPLAQQTNHLSRVAFMSRGARSALEAQGITDVASLAELSPEDTAFDEHYNLRALRSVMAGRASSLQELQAFIPEQSGTSGVMPRWADLHIYVMANFDLGSAITFAMGLDAFWMEPRPFGDEEPRITHPWRSRTFVIDQRDLLVERRELLNFLKHLNEIIDDAYKRNKETTVQLYVWDEVQYRHLTRIVGRHLSAILEEDTIAQLAWLFPPEELLPNAVMETRMSPITIVKDVIRSLLAAPVPHYYTLFEVARVYHHLSLPEKQAKFSVHPLFEDPLSDQIPSERAHDIWARTPRWIERFTTLERTVRAQLQALQTITRRLEGDLGHNLKQTAPKIIIGPPSYQSRISSDGQLWLAFAKLDAALGELEVYQTRAMPPHEREARFRSARLQRRLVGPDADEALIKLDVQDVPRRRVYRMRPESSEVKLRPGDFNFSLAPEADVGFLDRSLHIVTEGTPLQRSDGSDWRIRMERVTHITVAAIDRDAGIIVLDPDYEDGNWLDDLEEHQIVDFGQDVVLDPISLDYFTKRLRLTLAAIGNPSNAREDPIVKRAIGSAMGRKGRKTADTPAGDVLWSAKLLAESPIQRELDAVKEVFDREGIILDPSQWRAWELSLTRRLQLIWGPPGTGKSVTLRAVTLGAILDAHLRRRACRILICAPTYRAIDNVFLEVYNRTQNPHGEIGKTMQNANLKFVRTRSMRREADEHIPPEIDLKLTREKAAALRMVLETFDGISVVGSTPEQVFKLLDDGQAVSTAPLFDLIVLDEASQMDVAHAILPIASIAQDGALVIAGDPKQLPPIHQAKPPAGLENMVGSICCFFKRIHDIAPADLQENYRSNETIVSFAHSAGYRRELRSFSPDLCVNLVHDLPGSKPADWPQTVYWTASWSALLSPTHHATSFVYPEGMSAQSNPFEAEAIAALVFLLYRRLGSQPLNERKFPTGEVISATAEAYNDKDFWERGVGIVTPHRAQQALIVSRLQSIFEPFGISSFLIRGAVDTVERFQGQQRDIIIASYALGDPDAIREEDEFLMSLNRFNVMVSRARAKIITLVSQEVVNHLSGDNDVLRQSRLLKIFADSFCSSSERMTLGFIDGGGKLKSVPGLHKYR